MFEIDFSTSERSHTESQPQGTKVSCSAEVMAAKANPSGLIETEVPVPGSSLEL